MAHFWDRILKPLFNSTPTSTTLFFLAFFFSNVNNLRIFGEKKKRGRGGTEIKEREERGEERRGEEKREERREKREERREKEFKRKRKRKKPSLTLNSIGTISPFSVGFKIPTFF